MKDAKQRSREPVNNFVGQRLREIRMQRGLTCREMAKRTGIAPGSYSCLENGWYRISLDNLFRILHTLGAKLGEVWPKVNGLPDSALGKEQIAQALSLTERELNSGPDVEELLKAVCEAFGVTSERLRSAKRWGRLQEARAACAILSTEHPGLTLQSLARRLGMKPAALSRLVSRHRDQAREDPKFAAALQAARQALNSHAA